MAGWRDGGPRATRPPGVGCDRPLACGDLCKRTPVRVHPRMPPPGTPWRTHRYGGGTLRAASEARLRCSRASRSRTLAPTCNDPFRAPTAPSARRVPPTTPATPRPACRISAAPSARAAAMRATPALPTGPAGPRPRPIARPPRPRRAIASRPSGPCAAPAMRTSIVRRSGPAGSGAASTTISRAASAGTPARPRPTVPRATCAGPSRPLTDGR
jgi:hypothetical protein